MIAEMTRSNPPMVGSFVSELAHRLRGESSAHALFLTWMEQQLSSSYLTIGQLVQSENQQQAADQVSISNSIGSLRFLSAMDWQKFVDKMSIVEQTLQEDPAGIYDSMDFTTRDHYRHIVEEIARKSRLSENEVACEAIGLARQGAIGKNPDNRTTHVGFYFIDKGRVQLEGRAKVGSTPMDMLRKIGRRFPSESASLVVVPTMLTSLENIGNLMDALEVRFLANRVENLRFGLLTDFQDASRQRYHSLCHSARIRLHRVRTL